MKFQRRDPRGQHSRYLIAAGLLIAGAPADATMYSCRDSNGAPLLQSTTDGCASETCEIKANGAKDCEETKEQRSNREATDKREAECKERRRRSMLKELNLLEKYPKRTDIDTERDEELAANARDLHRAKDERDGTRKTLQKANDQADFFRPKLPVPSDVSAEIGYRTKHLADLELEIANAEAKAVQINQKYDELLRHYDRVLKHQFEPVPCNPN